MSPERLRHVQWDVVAVTLLLLVLGTTFVAWRLLTPSACPWLGPDATSWTPDGLVPRLPAGCVLPSTEPVVAAERAADVVHLTFADGRSATLPTDGFLSPLRRRLLEGAWTLLFTVLQFGLCVFAFVRQPADRGTGAALVFASGLLSSTTVTILGLPIGAAFTDWPRWLFVANTQGAFSLVWGAALLLVVQFPAPIAPGAGRFRVRAAIAAAPLVLWLLLVVAILARGVDIPTRMNWAIRAQTAITLVTMVALIVTALVRMVRMRAETTDVVARQQALWLGASGLSALMLALAFWIVPDALTGDALAPDDLIGLPGLLFVGGLGVALLRYRLFELEWLLVRVLVYTVLALLALAVYVGFLSLIAVTALDLDAVSAGLAATVVVALLAPLLRRRVEQAANWLVYREPQSPYRTLSRVAEVLAGRQVDFVGVAHDIRRALRLPHVRIESPGGMAESGAADAVPGTQPVTFPLRASEGQLVVRTRGQGDRLTDGEVRLLFDLSRQIDTAVHQAHLAEELQRSRERLVLAREEERRAIRRVMHDDLAPTLAGVALQIETARQLVSREPSVSATVLPLLDAISRDAATTSRGLRFLSYELRPPALDDRGLVAALEDAGLRLAPVKVELDADGLGDLTAQPLPAAVEVAAYRIATEAMTNVARHASAATCRVVLRRTASRLELEVRDDGEGLPQGFRPGVGVTSMRERAAELGGTCTVTRGVDGGTVVQVVLPLEGA